MNWNSNEFIWLDWAILVIGVILVAWAVYRSVQKDKRAMKGADSQDYLFGKENLGTLSVRPYLPQTSVQNT